MNTDHKCLPQHAIVHVVQRTKTKGNIIIPERAGMVDGSGRPLEFQQSASGTEESEYRQRAFLVASAGFYVHQGLKVDVEIPVGAEVYCADPDASRYGDMPEGFFRVHLSRIQLWRNVTKEDRERAIAEAKATEISEPRIVDADEEEAPAPKVTLQ